MRRPCRREAARPGWGLGAAAGTGGSYFDAFRSELSPWARRAGFGRSGASKSMKTVNPQRRRHRPASAGWHGPPVRNGGEGRRRCRWGGAPGGGQGGSVVGLLSGRRSAVMRAAVPIDFRWIFPAAELTDLRTAPLPALALLPGRWRRVVAAATALRGSPVNATVPKVPLHQRGNTKLREVECQESAHKQHIVIMYSLWSKRAVQHGFGRFTRLLDGLWTFIVCASHVVQYQQRRVCLVGPMRALREGF